MKTVGIIGLGDMGSGMAKNLIQAGFPLVGFDLRDQRLAALEQMGGRRGTSCAGVAAACDVVFVMVLNGDQVREVVLATNATFEGEATAAMLARALDDAGAPAPLRLTRIARGIPSGGEIVHMNAAILGEALRGRGAFPHPGAETGTPERADN